MKNDSSHSLNIFLKKYYQILLPDFDLNFLDLNFEELADVVEQVESSNVPKIDRCNKSLFKKRFTKKTNVKDLSWIK